MLRLLYELDLEHEALLAAQEEALPLQRELEESREKYYNLFEYAPVGYLTLDAKMNQISLLEQDDLRAFLYRAARELLINVVKHAHAPTAALRLWQENAHLLLEVADAGTGFELEAALNPQEPNRHFGLFSLQERLEYLGAKMEVESGPRQGTRIRLALPRPQE